MKKIGRPTQEKNDTYFWIYINKTEGKNLLKSLKKSKKALLKLIKKTPTEKGDYAYTDGKWSIKMVISHMIDTERIFAYRALCISRGDTSDFPGFDQDEYVDKSNMENISLKDLSKEFEQVRDSTISLFKNMAESDIDIEGKASGLKMTPRTIGWKISGHVIHHTDILKERYM